VQSVLGAAAATSPLRAQVLLIDALADLLLATGYCESPLQGNAARSPTRKLFKQGHHEVHRWSCRRGRHHGR
jgi:hypothetical protein